MCPKKVHPSIAEFKEFVKKHPLLVVEVRNGKREWQKLYEEWYMLGEENAIWEDYREASEEKEIEESETEDDTETSEKTEDNKTLGQIVSFIKNLDIDQVQGQINNMNHVISNLQQLIGVFRGSPGSSSETKKTREKVQQNNPFFFQKD